MALLHGRARGLGMRKAAMRITFDVNEMRLRAFKRMILINKYEPEFEDVRLVSEWLGQR